MKIKPVPLNFDSREVYAMRLELPFGSMALSISSSHGQPTLWIWEGDLKNESKGPQIVWVTFVPPFCELVDQPGKYLGVVEYLSIRWHVFTQTIRALYP